MDTALSGYCCEPANIYEITDAHLTNCSFRAAVGWLVACLLAGCTKTSFKLE
jgi:hypothetical protein